MGQRPLYHEAQGAHHDFRYHRGLWFDRFFEHYEEDWTINKESGKGPWIKAATGKAGDENEIKSAAVRLQRLCETLGGQYRLFKADWHFATGLGNPHPVENGFLWHPTLGTPFIPGAAVKGLVRAWVEVWKEFEADADRKQRLATIYRWFGSEDKDFKERRRLRSEGFVPRADGLEIDTEAGAFIFFDALPVEPVTLKADVMTPHMGGWYEKGGEKPTDAAVTPADWHDPVPVPFLVADKPLFQFCIAPRTRDTTGELDQVMSDLEQALQFLGAGAKTAVGYGRFLYDEGANNRILAEKEKQAINELPMEERLRAEVAGWTEKQLIQKLGKGRNKTRKEYEENWDTFLGTVIALHGDKIRKWEHAEEKSRKDVYKTVFKREQL